MSSTTLTSSVFTDDDPDLSSVDAISHEKIYEETVKLFAEKLNQDGFNSSRYTENNRVDIFGNHIKQTLPDIFDVPQIDFPNLEDVLTPKFWNKFHTLQEWEGYVIDVSENEFTARLLDLTADANVEDEEVTIPLSELAETDDKHLNLGSIFRWVIGHEYSEKGTLRRVSEIIFRDLPVMSPFDKSEGQKWAREIIESFKK